MSLSSTFACHPRRRMKGSWPRRRPARDGGSPWLSPARAGGATPASARLHARELLPARDCLIATQHLLEQRRKDGLSIEASRTRPTCKRSSCASERRRDPPRGLSWRGLCNQRGRISAARGSETAFSRRPRSISASEGGSLFRRVARSQRRRGLRAVVAGEVGEKPWRIASARRVLSFRSIGPPLKSSR
jgi:hypothetical protein